MPLEALLIPDNLTDSDSDGIGGSTDFNFIICLFVLTCEKFFTSLNSKRVPITTSACIKKIVAPLQTRLSV